MIGPVSLGGNWWAHNGSCSEVQIGPHIHYGQHVIVGIDPKSVPENVLAAYYVLFGNPDITPPQGILDATDIETTDAPPYETTAQIPTKKARRRRH